MRDRGYPSMIWLTVLISVFLYPFLPDKCLTGWHAWKEIIVIYVKTREHRLMVKTEFLMHDGVLCIWTWLGSTHKQVIDLCMLKAIIYQLLHNLGGLLINSLFWNFKFVRVCSLVGRYFLQYVYSKKGLKLCSSLMSRTRIYFHVYIIQDFPLRL